MATTLKKNSVVTKANGTKPPIPGPKAILPTREDPQFPADPETAAQALEERLGVGHTSAGEIASLLSTIDSTLTETADLVELLGNRIAPILGTTEPAESLTPSPTADSKLAQELLYLFHSATSIRRSVQSLAMRVAL